MSEKLPGKPELVLQKGALVSLQDDLPYSVKEAIRSHIDFGATYVVLAVTHHEDGPDTAWIGPASLTQEEQDTFEIEEVDEFQYANVFPISVKHLRAAVRQ